MHSNAKNGFILVRKARTHCFYDISKFLVTKKRFTRHSQYTFKQDPTRELQFASSTRTMVNPNLLEQIKAKMPEQMKAKLSDSSDSESQRSNSTTPGSKARRKASMLFKKVLKQGDESHKDGAVKKLQSENRKLRQELEDSNTRIRELELLNRAQEQRLLTFVQPTPNPSMESYTPEGMEYRDDEGEKSFSVEVAAITRGNSVQGEFLDIENEIHSTAPSAKTVPTGNDKKSNQQRKQHLMRQKLRRSNSNSSGSSRSFQGEDAYLDYFSRRNSPPLESITEVETRPSFFEYDEISSATSELTASVSSMGDEESIGSSSLMGGRRVSLYTMKSLLRISSERSEKSDTISFLPADENGVLFGEI